MSMEFDYVQAAQKVHNVLQEAFGPNVSVWIEEGWHGRLHLKIVSDAFDRRSEDVKQMMVWGELKAHLGPDVQAVSLVLAYGMDEI